MGRIFDPARRAREQLLAAEQRARVKAEARAVEAGVAETVALSQARGTEFAPPPPGPRAGAYRRQAGLDWLARKGRIGERQKAAGERYGALYRRAAREGAIGSTLDVRAGGGPAGAREERLLAAAEGTAHARRRLAAMRARLWNLPRLVEACDLVCGQELSPREATGGGERAVIELEALVAVALEALAGE